jgi:indolepyruvate ferredoxin oxidoreductase alpha subunit
MGRKDERFYAKKGNKVMMIGNEAIVRGCLECGVSYIAQYPGTPTSDIGETFQSLLENDPSLKGWLVHHWSINARLD